MKPLVHPDLKLDKENRLIYGVPFSLLVPSPRIGISIAYAAVAAAAVVLSRNEASRRQRADVEEERLVHLSYTNPGRSAMRKTCAAGSNVR